MAPADDPKIVAFKEKFSIAPSGIARLCALYTAATDGSSKLVVGDGLERRYDLGVGELSPLPVSTRSDDAFVRLRRAIEASAASEPSAEPEPPTGSAATPPPAASPEDVAELERQMKLLGYM